MGNFCSKKEREKRRIKREMEEKKRLKRREELARAVTKVKDWSDVIKHPDISASLIPDSKLTTHYTLPSPDGLLRTEDDVMENEGWEFVMVGVDRNNKIINKKNNNLNERSVKTIRRQVGGGGFGEVIQCRCIKPGENNDNYVCKKIQLIHERQLNSIKNELFIMNRHEHVNIVQMFDHFRIDNTFYIIMEYAKEGSLRHVLKQIRLRDDKMKEVSCKNWFAQICNGILFLHRNNIAHQDIKTDNILVFKIPGIIDQGTRIIKITDFGLSRLFFRPGYGYVKTNAAIGTQQYMSPQLIRLKMNRKSPTTEPYKSDVWALGITLYKLMTLEIKNQPFSTRQDLSSMHRAQLRQSFKSLKQFQEMDAACKHLILKLLDPNDKTRISMNNILSHAWFRGIDLENLIPTHPTATNTDQTLKESEIKQNTTSNKPESMKPKLEQQTNSPQSSSPLQNKPQKET